jgi:thiosulfate/3-mercaptopyruvate sulfurtransferase
LRFFETWTILPPVFSNLIQPSELAPHLLARGEPDWAVVDCRFYLVDPSKGEAEYESEHLPGAVYAHLDRDLAGPRTGKNGRHPLPSVEVMTERFSRWGIDERVQVVAYDTSQGQMAARLWWMLRYLGHDAAAVLDGGLQSWKSAGLPLESGKVRREPRRFTPRARPSMKIDVETLERERAGHLLIDARAPERFRGEVEPYDPVKGRIPGARNHPTASSLAADGRFLPPEELRARFQSILGSRPIDSVVSYCGSGVTACHNLLAMDVAGLRGAQLFPGSWSEWSADERRPIEREEKKV